MTTTLELTPKMLALIDQVTAAEAEAELHRRSKPKGQRAKASGAASQLWAPVLRQIAQGNTVVVAPTPETSVPTEVSAEIHHMPTVVAGPEPAIAPIVPITRKRRSRPVAPVTPVFDGAVKALTPIDTASTEPNFCLMVTDLVDALKAIEGPTKTRQKVLAILKSVVIAAAGESITLTTTDLDVTMQVTVAAEVATPGTVAIPLAELKALLPTAKKNQIGTVELRTVAADGVVEILTGSVHSSVRYSDVTEFPRLATVTPDASPVIRLDLDAIASVVSAATTEESRPILTGILFDGNSVVATDSYRLAECDSPTQTVAKHMLVPAKFLAGLVKRGRQAVAVASELELLVTDEDGMVMVSRLIAGEFPNYKSLFPTDTDKAISFDADEMIAALTAHLGRKPGATTPVRLGKSDNGKFPVRMVEADRFDVTIEVKGVCPLDVAFNPRYLRDFVTGGFDQVLAVDGLKPVKAERTDAGRRQRRLLMPTRVS